MSAVIAINPYEAPKGREQEPWPGGISHYPSLYQVI